ncbi:probable receptor-like protein kinase At1g80640 [Camellia sinensis]|uniref:probable receptor-like protein kinase At1g80640 n=1 Tax=Camellia sinensis TaxID=4442 RepID=UPI001036BBC8|nr:probable receptor-like protein kinase At1g80640 [Camellia sinensis]
MDWLSKIEHQNIVSLLGYCVHGEARFLVYEIMHNGSLESQLHGLTFGKEFTAAIEAKQIATEEAERAKFVVEKASRTREVLLLEPRLSHITID